ncbi:GNAT family N-acetyltransferase [Sinorhizobium sp. RAC02]|uniref:GNAT family N-acetyltransferase n=1 Tax=Sinorhizobium sp. RAC02 TaxID=1842534 RepID=UPI0008578F66|nr:GNAT family N-acetyltransferase [Sinorhizobium sp. RAC02]AOF89270.1 ABC transporter family protein [Sinorhizobium sp. RAC02]
MRIAIAHSSPDFDSYRAARVRSLFNIEDAHRFNLEVDLPLEEPWSLGLVVGPSGSGKTSIGRQFFGRERFADFAWPADLPLVDAIGPALPFDDVTAALSAVGLGSVPSWLRPHHVLSNGEQFRAALARILCERPAEIVIDEFTSVVDRQVARIGAMAFGKAWRRTEGRAVLLSCHYDIIDWLQPDWVLDTATGAFTGRYLRRRPEITLEIRKTGWEWWRYFEPHHYLRVPRAIAARCYVGFVDGEPVAHVAMSTRPGLKEARACRLVVMPDWQGAGIGLRFLNRVCASWRRGDNPYSRPMPTLVNTSHPGLANALRRHPLWAQVSASLYGSNKARRRRRFRARLAVSKLAMVGISGACRGLDTLHNWLPSLGAVDAGSEARCGCNAVQPSTSPTRPMSIDRQSESECLPLVASHFARSANALRTHCSTLFRPKRTCDYERTAPCFTASTSKAHYLPLNH